MVVTMVQHLTKLMFIWLQERNIFVTFRLSEYYKINKLTRPVLIDYGHDDGNVGNWTMKFNSNCFCRVHL